jgi:hypothetical protein
VTRWEKKVNWTSSYPWSEAGVKRAHQVIKMAANFAIQLRLFSFCASAIRQPSPDLHSHYWRLICWRQNTCSMTSDSRRNAAFSCKSAWKHSSVNKGQNFCGKRDLCSEPREQTSTRGVGRSMFPQHHFSSARVPDSLHCYLYAYTRACDWRSTDHNRTLLRQRPEEGLEVTRAELLDRYWNK